MIRGIVQILGRAVTKANGFIKRLFENILANALWTVLAAVLSAGGLGTCAALKHFGNAATTVHISESAPVTLEDLGLTLTCTFSELDGEVWGSLVASPVDGTPASMLLHSGQPLDVQSGLSRYSIRIQHVDYTARTVDATISRLGSTAGTP